MVHSVAAASEVIELPEPWCASALTVALPTYNEATNLPIVMEHLFALHPDEVRVAVVDDNSPDGTGNVADELSHIQPGSQDRRGTDRFC
jgi:dolichol-phosphate mannosyltransferase